MGYSVGLVLPQSAVESKQTVFVGWNQSVFIIQKQRLSIFQIFAAKL